MTIPKIVLEDDPAVTIENAGTVSAIEMSQPGTLIVDNSGEITSINTPARMIGGGIRTLGITNHSGSTIDEIDAPNTMITVQNDGTVGLLRGYFPSEDKDPERTNMVTLRRGCLYQDPLRGSVVWR